MKKLSKIFAAIMVIAMLAALAVPAMAATYTDATVGTGSITIKKAIAGQQYTIYRIADLESYSGTNYSYKVNDYWKAFFLANSINVDTTNHLEYTSTVVNAAQLAKDALAWAKADTEPGNNTAVYQKTAASDTVVFDKLPLGYYVIDSTQGALCMLTNTDPDGEINEKNDVPIIDKLVKEDSNDHWGHTNDDNLGAVVPFQIEVTKVAGAVNYIVGDNLSDGLTLDPNLAANITVTFGTTPGVAATDYTLYIRPNTGDAVADAAAWKTTLEGIVSAEQAVALKDYEFVVVLANASVEAMVNGTDITIGYTATINENAVVGKEGNPNEATLIYGNDPKSMLDPVKTVTYVWDFQVFKYTNADSSKKPLAGAEFSIFEKNPDVDPSATPMWLEKLSKVGPNGEEVYRHVHNPADTTGLVTKITTNDKGKFIIEGLDSDVYYMKEMKAPEGYHMLRSVVEVRIGTVGSYADYALDYTVANTVDGYIEVLNSTGVILPETGGIGTIIFITTGTILVLTMGVLLVVKKRMSQVVFTR